MRIGEVARLTGLSDSNIRFYEKKGLLAPARDRESKYRDYSEEDIAVLKRIVLYRKLNIPIETIDALMHEKLSLDEALKQQENALLGQIGMLEESLNLCRMMQESGGLDDETVTYYLNYVREEEEKDRQFAVVADFLDDVEDFSRTAFFDNIPYFFTLFVMHKRLARVLSVVWMLFVIAMPLAMFLEAYLTERTVSVAFCISGAPGFYGMYWRFSDSGG